MEVIDNAAKDDGAAKKNAPEEMLSAEKVASMAKSVVGRYFNTDARNAVAMMMLKLNLARVREKLGEVQTALTYEIGHEQGVGNFSVKEIQFVYGVDRSTAYRWKKFNCHPWLHPELDSSKRIRWTDLPKDETAERKSRYKPYRPRLQVITQARSAVRCAINKLKELDEDPSYDCYPYDEDCAKAAEELDKAAGDLELAVHIAVYGEDDLYND